MLSLITNIKYFISGCFKLLENDGRAMLNKKISLKNFLDFFNDYSGLLTFVVPIMSVLIFWIKYCVQKGYNSYFGFTNFNVKGEFVTVWIILGIFIGFFVILLLIYVAVRNVFCNFNITEKVFRNLFYINLLCTMLTYIVFFTLIKWFTTGNIIFENNEANAMVILIFLVCSMYITIELSLINSFVEKRRITRGRRKRNKIWMGENKKFENDRLYIIAIFALMILSFLYVFSSNETFFEYGKLTAQSEKVHLFLFQEGNDKTPIALVIMDDEGKYFEMEIDFDDENEVAEIKKEKIKSLPESKKFYYMEKEYKIDFYE